MQYGFVRTSRVGALRAAPVSLSPGSSLVGGVPVDEVLKRSRTRPDKTMGYARTKRAVGFDHRSPEGNSTVGGDALAGRFLMRIPEGECGRKVALIAVQVRYVGEQAHELRLPPPRLAPFD